MSNKTLKILLVLLIVISLVNAYFNYTLQAKIEKIGAQENSENKLEKPRLAIIPLGENPKIGNDEAPVKILVFLDYECPYCKIFLKDQLPDIQENYIDKNIAQVIFRDLPLAQHPLAFSLAEQAHIAHQNETFPDFLSVGNSLGYNATAWLENYNKNELGPDSTMFNRIEKNLEESRFLAGVAGITATPTFVINNRVLVGLRKIEELHALIDYSLSAPINAKNDPVAGSCN